MAEPLASGPEQIAAASRSPRVWGSWLLGMGAGGLVVGLVVWQLNLQAIERHISAARAGSAKLVLSGRIPPNQEVLNYLQARQGTLDERYQAMVRSTLAPPLPREAMTDPQLYFQEQLHDLQRMFERASAARGLPVPEQIGFPKEVPPSDTVPRLLVQLSLIREVTALILDRGVERIVALKIEDPEAVADAQDRAGFLTRLPVRVRWTGSLAQILKILAAIHAVEPLIDVRDIRVIPGPSAGVLEAELQLARYLPTGESLEDGPPEADPALETEGAARSAPRLRRDEPPAAPNGAGVGRPRRSQPRAGSG